MYSEVFCKVYDLLGWNYYPEAFAQQLLKWLEEKSFSPKTSLDLGCGTGILCQILYRQGIASRGMDLSEGMIAIARQREPGIPYDVGNMVTYRPEGLFDLVTCTGDALNHIGDLGDVRRIFENIHSFMASGGWLVFDILNEGEVSTSEPFEMDFDSRTRVWFQMTQPGGQAVELKIRVWEDGELKLEEVISETIHDPAVICGMLRDCGFREVGCAHRLTQTQNESTTWYITARKA